MKISVIVTTYNRPDALKKVLDGLLYQTRLPDEIIIADDGSDNDTKSIIRPYFQNQQVCIKHVWQEDIGFRAAWIRNKAIFASTGEYLLLLDGDCVPGKYFVRDHMDLAQKGCFFQGKRVVVKKSVEQIFNRTNCNSTARLIIHTLKNEISNSHHIIRIPFFPSYKVKKLSGIRSCNMGVFRDDIFAVNGFNHAFKGWGREDSELVVRLFKYGLKRNENPFRAICFHLWHDESTRDSLERNDEILKETLRSESFSCKSGLNDIIEQPFNFTESGDG
ncbi:glycosyltransferase family 2 protein [Desulfobacula sp.]|uniref:glycosyltransferase family 2 protein n=1 Tax=Desulfobacula sp. TaxID=2593537 RepID=UPI002639999C|nr:glycosyltransferase family 2 protein [Desulfobacula sp.]